MIKRESQKKLLNIVAVIGIIVLFSILIASGTLKEKKETAFINLPNPSAVYCVKLGYEYETITKENRGQYGICKFPDNEECKGWEFYGGICGQEKSYCAQQGYDLKVKNDGKDPYSPNSYVVCVDKETKKEIGKISDLIELNKPISNKGGCK